MPNRQSGNGDFIDNLIDRGGCRGRINRKGALMFLDEKNASDNYFEDDGKKKN